MDGSALLWHYFAATVTYFWLACVVVALATWTVYGSVLWMKDYPRRAALRAHTRRLYAERVTNRKDRTND